MEKSGQKYVLEYSYAEDTNVDNVFPLKKFELKDSKITGEGAD